VGNTIDWKNFVLKMFIFHVMFCIGLILVAEHTQKLKTLKCIKCSSGSPRKMPCCFSCTMLSGILANYRRQSRPVLVRTMLTSSHTFSCLLHLLITSVIALVGMEEGGDSLGHERSPTGSAAEPSSPFTCGSER